MEEMEQHLQQISKGASLSSLITGFSKYIRRQDLTRFLVRHELFKHILSAEGSIIECGVLAGSGLMSLLPFFRVKDPFMTSF